jgi:hypothetical protein
MVVVGDELVVYMRGWRRVLAVKRHLAVPISSVVAATHDPAARARVRTKLITRRHRRATGLFRLGTYHGRDGWSFWAVGLGRNAVLVETTDEFYRYLVVEVADPLATVDTIVRASESTRVSHGEARPTRRPLHPGESGAESGGD